MPEDEARLRLPSAPPPAAAEDPALALARRAAGGDSVATRRLLELVAPRVARAVRAVMGPGHPDLDDAVQLSFIGLIQALRAFRGECSPERFAARIAVRTAGAVRRRARTRTAREDGSVDPDTYGGVLADPRADRRKAALRELLDDLPEEQSEALAMRVALGWSLKDIAETTGVPVNTVRSRMRLAKEALRRRLADDPELAAELESTDMAEEGA
jgi:RNA polymerase sigma factor (sigma-70 family)